MYLIGNYGQIIPKAFDTVEEKDAFRNWVNETLVHKVTYRPGSPFYNATDSYDYAEHVLIAWLSRNCKDLWSFRFYNTTHFEFVFRNRNDALMFKLQCDVPDNGIQTWD